MKPAQVGTWLVDEGDNKGGLLVFWVSWFGVSVGWGGFGLLWAGVVWGEGVLEEREITR